MRWTEALFAQATIAAVATLALAGHLAIARWARRQELSTERRRIVNAIDSERLRIQRDLHDTAQQRIVSIRLRLGVLAEQRHLDRAALATMAHELDAALAEIRSVMVSNSPDLVERHGLPLALRRAAARAPLPILIDAPGFGRLAPDIERQVYFCCIEALQNVFKHSGAREAWVRLRQESTRMTFEISDDGQGFDLSRVTIGQGLRNVAYRISALGGTLSIGAHPGGGTCLRGEVPLSRVPGNRRRRTSDLADEWDAAEAHAPKAVA